MSNNEDLCKLTLELTNPEEELEFVLSRDSLMGVIHSLNNQYTKFINVEGTGIPVPRILAYYEEDMQGKSVVQAIEREAQSSGLESLQKALTQKYTTAGTSTTGSSLTPNFGGWSTTSSRTITFSQIPTTKKTK